MRKQRSKVLLSIRVAPLEVAAHKTRTLFQRCGVVKLCVGALTIPLRCSTTRFSVWLLYVLGYYLLCISVHEQPVIQRTLDLLYVHQNRTRKQDKFWGPLWLPFTEGTSGDWLHSNHMWMKLVDQSGRYIKCKAYQLRHKLHHYLFGWWSLLHALQSWILIALLYFLVECNFWPLQHLSVTDKTAILAPMLI